MNHKKTLTPTKKKLEIPLYFRDGRAPVPENDAISKRMSANKAKNTRPEIILRRSLWVCKLRGYRLHWKKAPGTPDIAFPGKKIAIFVNGCFWHRCPYCVPSTPKTHSNFWKEKFEKNQARDKKKIALLRQAGWRTFVFWECEIKSNISGCLKKIGSYIK
jgi:DNA mismatch endonuclease (patch repair protein)